MMTQQTTETETPVVPIEIDDPEELEPTPKYWFFEDHDPASEPMDPEMQLTWREVLLVAACLRSLGAEEGALDNKTMLELTELGKEDFGILFGKPLAFGGRNPWLADLNSKLWPVTSIPQPEGPIFWSVLEDYGAEITAYASDVDSPASLPELVRLFDKDIALLEGISEDRAAAATLAKGQADVLCTALRNGYHRYMAVEGN